MKRFSIGFSVFCLILSSSALFAADPQLQFRKLQTVNTVKMKQLRPVTAVQIRQPVKLKGVLRPIVPTKPVTPKGPDPEAAIDLSDMIDDADLLEDLSLTCGWDPHLIFQDKAAGNVFYYLPRGFVLVYDMQQGYGLNVQYNHLKEEGKPSVMLTAELAAPHQKGDIQLLKSILKQAFGLKATDKLTLKSISAIGAEADLQAISAGLSIPQEQVSLVLPAHFKKSFRMTLSLHPDETEEVLAQVSREGLSGNLNVKVGGASVPVPILIQYSSFSGTVLDGFDQWVESRPLGHIKNITPFPIHLDSINCYKVTNGQLERISKKLKPSTLAPEEKKNFKLPPVKKLLGNDVMLAWLGTQFDTGCTECISKIDRQVRKGVAAAASTRLKFEAIPSVFSDFDLYKIIIQVQTPYFEAEPGKVLVQETELTEEENISDELVIYLPEGKGPEPLLYRYRMKLITVEGNALADEAWTDSRTATRFFGASQVEPLLDSDEDLQ